MRVCSETYPDMVDVGEGHFAACHNKQAVVAALSAQVTNQTA